MRFRETEYDIYYKKEVVARLFVGGTLEGNNEIRIKRNLPIKETIQKIISDCPKFTKKYNLTIDYQPKFF